MWKKKYGPVRVEELEQHTDNEAGKWVWKTWILSTQLLIFQKHVYHSKMRQMDTIEEVKHTMLPWSSKPPKSKQNENHVSFQVLGTWTLRIELKALSPPSTGVRYYESKHFKYRMITSIASAAIYNLTVLLSKEDIQMKTTAIQWRYRREILLVLFEFPRGEGVCTPRKQCTTKVTHIGPGSKLLDSLGPRKIRLTSWECHIRY